jgi:hypothetical protein
MTFLLTLIVGAFILWQAICLIVLGFDKLGAVLDRVPNRVIIPICLSPLAAAAVAAGLIWLGG